MFNKVKEQIKQLEEWTYMQKYYEKYETHYIKELNAQLKEFDIELVVYDEIEYFRNWEAESFNYPYTGRKQLIGSYKFDFTNRS